MKRTTLLATLLMIVAACEKPATRVQETTNSAIQVDRLFEVDGCTVYRFMDMWDRHYFARCGRDVSTESQRREPCGKGCTRLVPDVIAVERP